MYWAKLPAGLKRLRGRWEAIWEAPAARLSAFAPLGLLAQDKSFWMPVRGSTTAGEVDFLFYFIFYISLFFFVGIVAALIFMLLRYRRRPGHAAGRTAHHNLGLELTWSIIPLILVIVIFYIGMKSYLNITTPPGNSYQITVTAQKWKWLFTYPGGYVDENLHVPLDQPVQLVLSSEDVIHSLFIPAFRVKRDAVPGRYAKVWFTATQPGEFDLFCAEYCGTSHSDMHALVFVHPQAEYDKWLAEASDFLSKMPPAEAGKLLMQRRGCNQCHSIDGTAGTGPSFKGLFGEQIKLADGSQVAADENYIRESILEPSNKVVSGYQPVMPTFQGKLKDEEILAIIEYLKTLK